MGGAVIGCGHNAIFGVGVVTTPYLMWAWLTEPCGWAWSLNAELSAVLSVRNLILQFLFGCCVVGVPAIVGILLES